MLENINDKTYKSIKGASEYLLYFYSESCRPCKMTSPAVEAFARDYPEVVVGKANAEETSELCDFFGIRSVPTLVLVKDGRAVKRRQGVCTEKDISNVVFGSRE